MKGSRILTGLADRLGSGRLVVLTTGSLLAMLISCGRTGFEWTVIEPVTSCADQDLQIDVSIVWNTFLGGSGIEYGNATAVDDSQNVYVAGRSTVSWGTPVRPFGHGNWDAFVAKLDRHGNLLWHTFLGQTDAAADSCAGIRVDSNGNVIVAGFSTQTWGTPVRAFSGESSETLVAKLDPDGNLMWHTFLGGSGEDQAYRVALDSNGNIHVTGISELSWGTPVRAFAGSGADAFVAKLDSGGTLLWNTFLGNSGVDHGHSLAVDDSGNIHVSGYSASSWGTPLRAFSGGGADAFAARLNSSGALVWNTFLGGSGWDEARGIALDGNGDVFASGLSEDPWGSPVRSFSGHYDAFVTRLDGDGNQLWNTFLGGNDEDVADGMAVSASGGVYLSGFSRAAWGVPVHAYAGGPSDAFAARLDSIGALVWHTFVGGNGSTHPVDDDYGNDLALDNEGNLYLAGGSAATWGSPLRALSEGERDALAVKITDATVCAR